jgi:hypothetical protein
MLSRLFGIKSNSSRILTDSVGLVYVDAENCKTSPQDLMFSITNHHGSKPAETFAYSKWSAKGPLTKKYREAGFRLLQADSGDNNADIMMSLDAYERIRDLASMGVQGNVYICFHGDRGFTHLLEKLRAISGWRSIWVTSNNRPNKMIENSASETLRITSSQKDTAKNAPVESNSADNFKEIIIQVIGKEEIRSSVFGQKIIKYQKENGWNETGKKAFNIRFGLPKNQTYKTTISNELSSDIEILFPESEHRPIKNPIFKRASTSKNLRDSSLEVASLGEKSFPRIERFNDSQTGKRFPREPEDMASAILKLSTIISPGDTIKEVRNSLHEATGMSKSRLSKIVTASLKEYLQDGVLTDEVTSSNPKKYFQSIKETSIPWTEKDYENLIEKYFSRVERFLMLENNS